MTKLKIFFSFLAWVLFLGLPLWAQMVKNPPVMQETWVQSLGWEDPLEKGMATHSSILTWRIYIYTVHGVEELDMTEQLSLSLYYFLKAVLALFNWTDKNDS